MVTATRSAKFTARALGDKVVVLPEAADEKTPGGIVLPDQAKERPTRGSVVAVGKGRRLNGTGQLIPLDVSVGDTVIYSNYAGSKVEIDGEEYVVMSEADVLLVL